MKLRYSINNKDDVGWIKNLFSRLVQRDELKRRALDYLFNWEDRFWLETDERLKELTNKLERDFQATLGGRYTGVVLSARGARQLSREERVEIKNLSTQYIDRIQIKELYKIFDLLKEDAFNDKQKSFYILIDNLDQEWATTDTRCHFIRALIEEIRSFRNVPNIKIIAALRRDLLDLVLEKTREAGFQREKYDSYVLQLHWSQDELHKLLDLRVQEIYKRQYTSGVVRFDDVFPSTQKQTRKTAIEYLTDRSLMRPRDVIQFANECFIAGVGKDSISWKTIQVAEKSYSIKRLKAIIDEWLDFYPGVELALDLIRGLYSKFTRTDIDDQRLNVMAGLLCEQDKTGPLTEIAKRITEPNAAVKLGDLAWEGIFCLYHIGALGVKIAGNNEMQWAYIEQSLISRRSLKRANKFEVHPMLRHALEIREPTLRIRGALGG